jgi:hypothetical protein
VECRTFPEEEANVGDDEIQLHRRLGAELFNRVWDLLVMDGRTPEQDEEMLHAAHASLYHWSRVEEGPRSARGEWLCSWVYSELGRAEPALHHAHRCEALCREYSAELEDFDLPAMHEALARAQLVAGNREEALHRLQLASRLCAEIEDPEDREIIQSQIDSIAAAAA